MYFLYESLMNLRSVVYIKRPKINILGVKYFHIVLEHNLEQNKTNYDKAKSDASLYHMNQWYNNTEEMDSDLSSW